MYTGEARKSHGAARRVYLSISPRSDFPVLSRAPSAPISRAPREIDKCPYTVTHADIAMSEITVPNHRYMHICFAFEGVSVILDRREFFRIGCWCALIGRMYGGSRCYVWVITMYRLVWEVRGTVFFFAKSSGYFCYQEVCGLRVSLNFQAIAYFVHLCRWK